MADRILVAYATHTGSTAEVAKVIGEELSTRGFDVDVAAVKVAGPVSGYQAVVLGSAANGGRWLPEAVEFVSSNQAALRAIPVAVFCVHIMNAGDEEQSRRKRLAYLDDVRRLIEPVDEAFFLGIGPDPKKDSWLARWMFKRFGGAGEGDRRDWEKIREWASGVLADQVGNHSVVKKRRRAVKQRTIGVLVASALAVVVAIATLGSALAQPQPGFGPGGMMGQGGMMGGWVATSGQVQPLKSLDEAQQAFQRYIDATGNSNLALDEVMQFQANYYAMVKDTSTGEGAFELLANPHTGAVFPEIGPNMMWNTQYGHVAGLGMMGGFVQQPSVAPSVSAGQAQQIAQQWLDQNQPGSTTETADTFPGYYTLHITKHGTLTGMLSVNAYTGQVWYHTWHGPFVASTEV